jgi:uncharacterized protein (TIGR01777 family)
MKFDKRILVTGGTGFVGTKLRSMLASHGHWVSIASRSPKLPSDGIAGVDYVPWLPDLSKYDAVVNLAGANIFSRRWNAAYKEEIRASRVEGTRKVVDAMAAAAKKPTVLVNASAIGIYGDQGERPLPETAKLGDDFLADVCKAWEREAQRAESLGVRVVRLRSGVVLGRNGGALKTMLPPFRLGLGGPIGSGKAWFSWIHIQDLAELIHFALMNPSIAGPVNGVAPGACTNKDYTKALGRALHRPTLFPLPPAVLRLMLGEVAEVITGSQRCTPTVAQQAGFEFKYPDIDSALKHILS